MNIVLLCVGKTDKGPINDGCDNYLKRLKHYHKTEVVVIPDSKKIAQLDPEQRKIAEGELILKQVENTDLVILLDEKGKEFTSRQFASFFQKQLNTGAKRIVFVVGGAFGFSSSVYERANNKLALSKMTFSHQMIRLFFLEQLYRANTILKNEPYHND